MGDALKFFFCLLFAILLAEGRRHHTVLTDDESDPQEKEREFIIEQNKLTQEFLKLEMEAFSENMLELLNLTMTVINSRIGSVERSIANLSEKFNERISRSDSKIENSIANLSETFNERISRSDSKIERSISNLSGTFSCQTQRPEINSISQLLQLEHPIGVPVKEMNGSQRTILYAKDVNTTTINGVYRMHWMIQEPNIASLNFIIKNNNLGPNDLLTFTGISTLGVPIPLDIRITHSQSDNMTSSAEVPMFQTTENITIMNATATTSTAYDTSSVEDLMPSYNEYSDNSTVAFEVPETVETTTRPPSITSSKRPTSHQLHINSRTPNTTEFTIEGFVTIVTLTLHSSNNGTLYPGFVLLVYGTNETGIDARQTYHSQVVKKNGLHEVSFPEGNTENYRDLTSSAILIAPPSGREFKITLKYLDTESGYDYLRVFSLDGNSTSSSSPLKRRPDPTKRWSGSSGVTSETLGYSTAAVLFFRSDQSNAKRGYKVEIRPE